MSMLARTVGAVIGVDTHRDHHTVAVVDPTGAALTSTELPTDAFGYRRMLAFARDHAPGRRVWAIEGTGSFGAGLTTYLLEQQEWVVEIDRPARPARRNGSKTDELDAVRAAREALARDHLAQPRRRGDREAMRVLLTTRAGTVTARTKGDLPAQGPDRRRSGTGTQPAPAQHDQRPARPLRPPPDAAAAQHRTSLHRPCVAHLRPASTVPRSPGQRLGNRARRARHRSRTGLLALPGVGVITAAQILISWSHTGRIRNEAAFAALAGVAPIPASSGQIVRYRLNRSGDRQLNRALHTIVLSRLAHDPATKTYASRRTADGKSPREIKRCLKRAVARQVYRLLERTATQAPAS